MDLSDYKLHQQKTNLQPAQAQSALGHKRQFSNPHHSNMISYLSHKQEKIHLVTGFLCYRASCYLILRSRQVKSHIITIAINLSIVKYLWLMHMK